MGDVCNAFSRGAYQKDRYANSAPAIKAERPAPISPPRSDLAGTKSGKRKVNFVDSWNAILTIAYKEFVHVWRDRRVLLLILVLPPFFTLVFGHAFEGAAVRDVSTMFFNADGSNESQKFTDLLHSKDVLGALVEGSDNPDKVRKDISDLLQNLRDTFAWKPWVGDPKGPIDLVRNGADAAIVIPPGWGKSLQDGKPMAMRAVLDGSDTNTAPSVQAVLQTAVGTFQLNERYELIKNLPSEVVDLGEQL